MEILTIGFTKRSAADFFGALEAGGVRRVLDVRLNNRSQLAGYTKMRDLPFFLERILGAEYEHEPLLAPTSEMLSAYRHADLDWERYAEAYVNLIKQREVERFVSREKFSMRTALLCSERFEEQCHRRLAAEYLASSWGEVRIRHL
jgi:uncharacterized protein (DUF488 family)